MPQNLCDNTLRLLSLTVTEIFNSDNHFMAGHRSRVTPLGNKNVL